MNTKRILVVDDESSIRSFVGTSMRQDGYEVVEAENGLQALQTLKATLIDLVILDIAMPNMDGFEVCRQIRLSSEIPIIMISAQEDELSKVKSLHLGADDYLVKPFELKELRTVILRHLPSSET